MGKFFLSYQGACGHIYAVPVEPLTLQPAADPEICPHCNEVPAAPAVLELVAA